MKVICFKERNMIMKAAIYRGVENVTVDEVPMPECGDHDVILKNVRASICGTDIGAYYHGGNDAGIFPGHTFGHEMASVVYKKGALVDDSIKIGMRVFPNPTLSKRPDSGLSSLEICDECGAFSQYVQIQDAKLDYNLFELPDNVSFEEGAIIEPFSVAMHGINQIHVNKNDKVVIFGAGMIGLCALCACLSKGVKDVIVSDVNEWRLSVAEKMGAIPFNSAKGWKDGDLKEFLMDLYGSKEKTMNGQPAVDIDAYIDTSGAAPVIPSVLDMAKIHARLSIVALYHRSISINPYQISCTEMQIKGSFAYTNDDIREVIQVLKSKKTKVKDIITHHYTLDQINEAFRMSQNQREALKIQIDYD